MGYDSQRMAEDARAKLPLPILMQQHGDDPKKKKCFVCGKESAGTFAKGGRDWFKCHHSDCPTGNKGLDEVGYLAQKMGLSSGAAWVEFLKMAGVWRERERLSPSSLPGATGRKNPPPPPPPPVEEVSSDQWAVISREADAIGAMQDGGDQPAVISDQSGNTVNDPEDPPPPEAQNGRSCEEASGCENNLLSETVKLNETSESNSAVPTTPIGVTSDFGLGVSPQDQIGAIGTDFHHEEHEAHEGPEKGESEKPDAEFLDREEPWLIRLCLATIVAEQTATVSLLQRRHRLGFTRASKIMGELERDGFVGPADGAEPRKILSRAMVVVGTFTAEDLRAPEVAKEVSLLTSAATGVGGELLNPVLPGNLAVFPSNVTLHPDGGGKPPGGGDGGSGDGDDEDPEHREGLAALREFYAQLRLNDRDKQLLWEKRGLTAETSEALGFVSNERDRNLELLRALSPKYSFEALKQVGLYSYSRSEADGKFASNIDPVPEKQFFGWGIVGKRKVERDERRSGKKDDGLQWGWCEPILIPYFDAQGRVVALRPHKGNPKGRLPQIYFARRKGTGEGTDAVARENVHVAITEGEFKAAAIWQALCSSQGPARPVSQAGAVMVAAVPGITMIHNWFAKFELFNWLDEVDPGRIVIGYDNEEKGDLARYPDSYKADEYKRYDTIVWARRLAMMLNHERWDARVCVLPDEWRDSKGKADWDGALSMFLREEAPLLTPVEKSGELWLKVGRRVAAEFRRAIDTARRVNDFSQGELQESQAEKIIARKLKKISYERKLPSGGSEENATADRLNQFLRELRDMTKDDFNPGFKFWLTRLARTYKTLDGQYYAFKPLHEGKVQGWEELRNRAWRQKDDVRFKKLAWCADIALKGTPTPVSNFTLDVFHVVQKLDGRRDTMVRLKNVHGEETRLIPLDAKSLSRPSDFRIWLRNAINGTWSAGERELQMLQMDIDHAAQWKDVVQVANYGTHKESGLTFFKDAAYDERGNEILPDPKTGIFWVNSKGWSVSERDHEGEDFCQGAPVMKPDHEFSLCDVNGQELDEEGSVRQLFESMSYRMVHTLGDFSGYLAIGWMLACGAAHKVFGKYTQWPGLWVHGEQGQGKTSLMRWLLRIWGFADRESGVALKDSTKVGISIAMQQYGDLPVWLEEFQPDSPSDLVEKIKNLFNRESGLKKTFGEGRRKIVACAIVTGVAMSSEPQVRSRYAHVLVSAANRKGNFYDWFEENSKKNFPFLGRWLLRHREKYTDMVMGLLRDWMDDDKSPELKVIESRARFVHGVAYAGYAAFAWLCQSATANAKLADYKTFILHHAIHAAAEVKREVNVEMFFQLLFSCFNRGVFGDTKADMRRFFYVRSRKGSAPGYPEQTDWKSYELCFRPKEVLELIRQDLRRSNKSYPLDVGDLRAQMSTRPYFIPNPKKARFGGAVLTGWAVALDRFPELGYTPHTDEELAAARADSSMSEGWVDPRKGELIALCERLEMNEEEKLG